MGYASAAEALMRRKMLENIYDRMTDEEKKLFVQMAMQDKSHTEIMQALKDNTERLDRLQKTQQTFAQDFLSNVAGNAAYDGALWLLRRLARLAG